MGCFGGGDIPLTLRLYTVEQNKIFPKEAQCSRHPEFGNQVISSGSLTNCRRLNEIALSSSVCSI